MMDGVVRVSESDFLETITLLWVRSATGSGYLETL